jgi:hypothetical protein
MAPQKIIVTPNIAKNDEPFSAESTVRATPIMRTTLFMSTMTISWLILVFSI